MNQRTRILITLAALAFLATASSAHAMLHPGQGRFLQRDPIGYRDGANLYEYTRSHPPASRDPSGLSEVTFPGSGILDIVSPTDSKAGTTLDVRPNSPSVTLSYLNYSWQFPAGTLRLEMKQTLRGRGRNVRVPTSGVVTKMWFDPGAGVADSPGTRCGCKDIRFIQVARGTDNRTGGRVWSPNVNRTTATVDATIDALDGWFVDVTNGGGAKWDMTRYYTDHRLIMNKFGFLTSQPHTKSGYWLTATEKLSAELFDEPGYPEVNEMDLGVNVTQDFETCAVCREGLPGDPTTGVSGTGPALYGCVQWGFRMTRGGVIFQSPSASTTPSLAFLLANRAFDKIYPKAP